MARLARGLGGVDLDVAQSFGLFCDVGIPLLMQRFSDYGKTLKACNDEPVKSFTEIEQAHHNTAHAVIGGIMARSWGMSPTLCMAIRLHHDYSIFQDPKVPNAVMRLIAMSLVAETAIQRFAGMNSSTEWNKGGDYAASTLVLNDQDVEDWIDGLLEDFAIGKA
jgi:HD-like signal output (HDOD) protein